MERQPRAFNEMLEKREQRIAEWALEEDAAGMAALRSELAALQTRAAEAAQELVERDDRIEALLEAAVEREALIQHVGVTAVQVNHRLARARESRAWWFAQPARMLEALRARRGRGLQVDLVAFHQLVAEGGGWRATGDDAQFLLVTEREWQHMAGWYWLEIDLRSAQPFDAQLYFDVGRGFDAERRIDFTHPGQGAQRIALRVPADCSAIRFDPCNAPANFSLFAPRLHPLERAPELPADLASQRAVYAMLDGQGAEAVVFQPRQSLEPSDKNGYAWRSTGDDPWFLAIGLEKRLRAGWQSIELCMRASNDRGMAKLYFDLGSGFSERDSVVLPYGSGQPMERVHYLASVPERIRLDPLEASGWFSIERLQLTRVLRLTARERMLARLAAVSRQHRDQPIDRIWASLKREAIAERSDVVDLLLRRYARTFPVIYGPRGAVSYEDWIAKFETPEYADAGRLESASASLRHQPLVSVVMPVYNSTEPFLRRAIESVLGQSYPRWELCIADDASTEPQVRTVLEEYARRDRRIKVTFRAENGHISAASNSALALAAGEYVALLDHDDELAPHALYFVAEAIDRNPGVQMLYSDEDKIDDTGRRFDPHFKPDWNPDQFLSQNYVSHLGVYRRDLLERVGGFRLGVEGSQDYDLLLRCLPHLRPVEIVHIPRVLYHWRVLEGSTAMESGEKAYASEAGVTTLRNYFRALGREEVGVEAGLVPNTYHVRYPIPQPAPLVSLLIPTRDRLDLLEPCLRSIFSLTTYPAYEILILDNQSQEPATLEYFRRIQEEDARVRVLRYPHPFNFSAINNFGVREAKGELVGLVNNDIEVISPAWLAEMASHALRPEIGCVGAKLYYDDDTIQHAGVIVGLGGVAGHSHKHFARASSGYFHRLSIVQNLSAVTAACLVVRKAVYEQVGGFEEAGLSVAFNDVDFCLKVRAAGYRNLWTPYAELYHHESKSRGIEDSPEKVERFNGEIEFMKAKWGEALSRDPYYSQNLTHAREDFSLR